MTLEVTVEQVSRLADVLRAGGVIAYPTEAVFGLGCDPQNERAVADLVTLKKRPLSRGFLLICGSVEQALRWIHPNHVSSVLQGKFFGTEPTHTTWIFRKAPGVPRWLVGEHEGIAIRVTRYAPAAALCNAFGGAIVSTSANPHGLAPARKVELIRRYFADRLAGILLHPVQGMANPSTLRDALTGAVVRP